MDLTNLFDELTIGDLWPSHREIVQFRTSSSAKDCLRILQEEGIISAPVTDEVTGKLLGFVDVLDFVLFLIGLFPKDVTLDKVSEEKFQEIVEAGKLFETIQVGDVLAFSMVLHLDYQNTFPVTPSTPIPKLIDMFYLGVHRVPVVSTQDGKTVLNVISQSDLLAQLAQLLPFVSEQQKSKTIGELNLFSKDVVTIDTKTRTITALSRMNRTLKNPPLSALPIVDDKGKIVGNFSASNLRGLNKMNLMFLLLPVLDYLDMQPKKPFLLALQNEKSKRPITVTSDVSYESAVMKMVASKVHRLWVVDTDGKPIGVLSMTDIFRVLLSWTKK